MRSRPFPDLTLLPSVNFFDSNCMLGPTNTNREPSFISSQDLLSEMDRVGIGEALVFSSRSLMSHPDDGNRMILKETVDHPRLHPCWVLLPPGTRELPDPKVLIREMQEAGVRAARLFPAMHNYPFVTDILAPLLDVLAGARIPLFLDTGRRHWSSVGVDWPEVFRVCEAYPDLPLVLVREGGTTQRVLYGRWQRYPNLLIETSYLQTPNCLEEIARDYGPDRLLFGTGMPNFDPGPPMSTIRGSSMDDEGGAKVAGDNLRRLMGLEPSAKGKASWPCGGDGFRVFDAHGHLGPWEKVYYPFRTAERIVSRMDECGVEKLAVSDMLAIGPDFRSGNSRVGEAVGQASEANRRLRCLQPELRIADAGRDGPLLRETGPFRNEVPLQPSRDFHGARELSSGVQNRKRTRHPHPHSRTPGSLPQIPQVPAGRPSQALLHLCPPGWRGQVRSGALSGCGKRVSQPGLRPWSFCRPAGHAGLARPTHPARADRLRFGFSDNGLHFPGRPRAVRRHC